MDELIEFAMGIHRGNCNDSFNGLCTCGIRLKAVKARDELRELRNQLEISNQQLKLGKLLNNDLQKEVDSLNKQLEEKQKIIDEQLEVIKALSKIKYYDACGGLMVQDRTQPVPLIKKAREYLQRMESKK